MKKAFKLAEVFFTLFAAKRKPAFTFAEFFSTLFASKRKTAFTLAEVLITLGIIGIVAAMTLPALTANSKKSEYSSKLKKFYSVMQQAMILSELDNGDPGEWQKEGGVHGDIKDEDGNPDFKANGDVIIAFINKYFKPYLKISSIGYSEREIDDSNGYKGEAYLSFADGSYVYMHNGNCLDIIYDLNGQKGPNEYGKDLFCFLLCSNEKCSIHGWWTAKCGVLTHNYYKEVDRNTALNLCKSTPKYCSVLLQMDNFEFKKDYPY